MASLRIRHAFQCIRAGFLNRLLTVVLKFVSRTIFLRIMSAELLGLDSVLLSVFQVINLAELGIDGVIVYFMYKPIAFHDDDLVCSLLYFYRKTYRVIGYFVLTIGVAFIPFLSHFVDMDSVGKETVYVAYGVYLINVALTYFLFAHKKAVLVANQRNDVVQYISGIAMLIQSVWQIVGYVVTGNYYVYIVGVCISTLFLNISAAYAADKLYPQYICEDRGRITESVYKNIKMQVGGLFFGRMGPMLRNAIGSLLLSVYLGLEAVTQFYNYLYVINVATSILSVSLQSATASIGNSIATASREKNYNDFMNIHFLHSVISGIIVTLYMCFIQVFMRFWAGESMLLPLSDVVLFAMYLYVLLLGDVKSIYTDAVGLWWQNRNNYVVQIVFLVIFGVILGKYYGIHGIILSFVISAGINNLLLGVYVLFISYFKQCKIRSFYLQLLLTVSVNIVFCSLCCQLVDYIHPNSILEFFFVLLLLGVIASVFFHLCFRKYARYRASFRLIKRLIKPGGELC